MYQNRLCAKNSFLQKAHNHQNNDDRKYWLQCFYSLIIDTFKYLYTTLAAIKVGKNSIFSVGNYADFIIYIVKDQKYSWCVYQRIRNHYDCFKPQTIVCTYLGVSTSLHHIVVLDTVTNFLITLGTKSHMHLMEITIVSLNDVILRPMYQNYEHRWQKLSTLLENKVP